MRSVPDYAKSGPAAPNLLSFPRVASGDDGAGIVAARNAGKRRMERTGNVFNIARIDGGSLHLYSHLPWLGLRNADIRHGQDGGRPVPVEAQRSHGVHETAPECRGPMEAK